MIFTWGGGGGGGGDGFKNFFVISQPNGPLQNKKPSKHAPTTN
jgi:hypothetical protein